MKGKSEKLTSILFVLVAVLLGIGGFYVVIQLLFVHSDTWKYNADVKQCKEELNIIVEYIHKEYSKDQEVCLDVSIDKLAKEYYLTDYETSDVHDSKVIKDALKVVYEQGFRHKDSRLDSIHIHGDEIYFCGNNLQYALVYSPEGQPQSASKVFREADVNVMGAGDGWYHIRRAVKYF